MAVFVAIRDSQTAKSASQIVADLTCGKGGRRMCQGTPGYVVNVSCRGGGAFTPTSRGQVGEQRHELVEIHGLDHVAVDVSDRMRRVDLCLRWMK